MKSKILQFVLFVIFFTLFSQFVNSQAGWQQLPAPSPTAHLYGIYFKDILTGIVYDYRTTDGGQSWTNFNFGGYAMTFADANTGYIVPGIYKTTNTGLNWVQQTSPASLLYGVSFPNVNTGYACGDNVKIIKTTNGGNNWILLTSGVTGYIFGGVSFIDENIGYIAGSKAFTYESVILKTINGGVNWSAQNFAAGTGFQSIFFTNSNTGFVGGAGKIYKTTDAGNSWVEKTSPSGSFLNSIIFKSPNIGYMAGWGGTIIKTTDGGETWFQQTTGTGSDLESVYFLNDNTGFVCGDNGKVFKTTDGGGPPIGITPISSELPEKFSLSQNYPNPFNPTTNINFSIPQKSYVKIIIYDAGGKVVDRLVNFELNVGTYKVDWQASNFPSGVYFYSFQAGDYKESKKMILIK